MPGEKLKAGNTGVETLSGRLLVVDDDEPSRELLARRLQRAGHVVEMAASGTEALRMLEGGGYDLVLLDRSMPRVSGLEVLKQIRAGAATSRLPVIMVTAEAQGHAVLEALQAGASDYITKPVDFAIISARIKNHLERLDAERRLAESERRYALAAEASANVVMDYSPASGDLYLSPQWNQMLGLPMGEVPHRDGEWFARVHPLDLARLQMALSEQADGRQGDAELEYRLRHADGTYRWVRCRSRATAEPGQDAPRITGSFTDVTSAKFADPLTGLANRVYLFERLGAAMDRASRGVEPIAVLFLDLDGFKYVNDSLGHAFGDQLLIQVADRLRRALAPGQRASRQGSDDVVIARLGGDEFAVLVSSDGLAEGQRLVRDLSQPFPMQTTQVYLSASIGIARFGPETELQYESAHEMLRDADTAMYSAKAHGKNRVEIFTKEMHAHANSRLMIGNAIRDAVANREFTLAYQPIVLLVTREVIGVEALLRWPAAQCPVQEVIHIGEELGVMGELGQWVLEESCRRMAQFDQVRPNLTVHVNVSGVQFANGGFHQLVLDTLERTGFSPRRLLLEITETSMMRDTDGVLKSLRVLKSHGVHLAIDDFGTGYSSLSYLHRFPFDTLKLDQSFLRSAGQGNLEIVRAVIGMARTLRMRAVAEGIETAMEADHLRHLGCDYGQGYYFAAPLAIEEALEFLAAPKVAIAPAR